MYHQRLQGDSGSSAGGADTLQPSTDTRRLDSIRAHFHQPASGDIIVVQALLKQAQKGGESLARTCAPSYESDQAISPASP
jgi:hypothetical protein